MSLLKDPLTGDIVDVPETTSTSLRQLSLELGVKYGSFHYYARTHGLLIAVEFYRKQAVRRPRRQSGNFNIFGKHYTTQKDVASEYGISRKRLKGMSDEEIESYLLNLDRRYVIYGLQFKSLQDALCYCGGSKAYRILAKGIGCAWTIQQRLEYLFEYKITAQALSRKTKSVCCSLYRDTRGHPYFLFFDYTTGGCYIGSATAILQLNHEALFELPEGFYVPRTFKQRVEQKFRCSLNLRGV